MHKPCYRDGMEFSYRITEDDMVRAYRLKLRQTGFRRILRIISLSIFGLGFISVVIELVARMFVSGGEFTSSSSLSGVNSELIFIVLVIAFASAWWLYLPWQIKRQYRRNPAFQSEITVCFTPALFSLKAAIGTSSETVWSVYKSWREGDRLVLLMYHSNIYQVINTSGLSEEQREELRDILSSVLPKK